MLNEWNWIFNLQPQQINVDSGQWIKHTRKFIVWRCKLLKPRKRNIKYYIHTNACILFGEDTWIEIKISIRRWVITKYECMGSDSHVPSYSTCRALAQCGLTRTVKTIKLRFRSGPETRERVSIWDDNRVQSRAKPHGPLWHRTLIEDTVYITPLYILRGIIPAI